MITFAFYFFAILITALFLVTVMSSNILYAMTALAAGMVLISGLFFMLGADFLGVVQLIVYVGAVMALYSFAMMFFDMNSHIKEKNGSAAAVFVLGGAIALILVLVFVAPMIGQGASGLHPAIAGASNPQSIGMVLFTKYLVPFEVAAIMLLVAMIAGIILAGKKMDQSLSTTDTSSVVDDSSRSEK